MRVWPSAKGTTHHTMEQAQAHMGSPWRPGSDLATMRFIDDSGTTVPAAQELVVDPSLTKGDPTAMGAEIYAYGTIMEGGATSHRCREASGHRG